MRSRSAWVICPPWVNIESGPPGARCSTAKPIIETRTSSTSDWAVRRSRNRPMRPGSARPVPGGHVPHVGLDVDVRLVADQPGLDAFDRRGLVDRQQDEVLAD